VKLGPISLRYHRAAKRLLEGGGEFVFRLNWDVSAAVLLGETLGLGDALLSSPRKTFTRKPMTLIVSCAASAWNSLPSSRGDRYHGHFYRYHRHHHYYNHRGYYHHHYRY
jgi:hypothetical protein